MATTFGTTTQFDQIPHNNTVVTSVNESALQAMETKLGTRVKAVVDEAEENLSFSVGD